MNDDIIYATADFHVIALHDEDCQSPLTDTDPGFEWDFQINRHLETTSRNFPRPRDPDYWWVPVYGYVHSGVALSLTPFSCPWDSGVAGVVAVKRPSRGGEWRTRKAFLAYLTAFICTYNAYLAGECYGYTVVNTDTGEKLDSCWGFIGSDPVTSGLMEQAEAACNAEQKRFDKTVE